MEADLLQSGALSYRDEGAAFAFRDVNNKRYNGTKHNYKDSYLKKILRSFIN